MTDRAGGSLLAPDIDQATPPTDASAASENEGDRSRRAEAKRRFTWASVIGIALPSVPFIWILWSLWGPVNPLRAGVYQNNFFDLQTRALFHGKLSLPTGSLGVEGFVHDGKTYTYFGLFPSVLRMPVFLFTNSLDDRLTAPSMLIAWFLTGLVVSLLCWRIRHLIRGDAAMGWGETVGYGIFVATCMGGTIWMLLASIPYVFSEDIAWSICLTIASLFVLLGVLERPTWTGVIVGGVLITCACFDRQTTGWACVVCAGLIAFWFLLGFGGAENRRWFGPLLAAGLIPLVLSSAVNYAKFGVPFGVPVTDQVYTHVNAYRRRYLAANHNSEVGTNYILTNLVTYLRPDGLSLSRVFPFVTLPTGPPTPIHGVLFDRLYRTSSVTASSPLLFILSIWGFVTAFRPKAIGRVSMTRPILIAAASAAAALMLWGYIAPRYIGDFVPLLVVASAVAVVDVFRRLEQRRRWQRISGLTAILLLALFSIAANIGMAIVPNEEWSNTQLVNYVHAQKTVSDITGHPLSSRVHRGEALPVWAPAGELFIVGNCDGLYISTGEQYWEVPDQELARTTWSSLEVSERFQHSFQVTFDPSASPGVSQLPLVRSGPYTVYLNAEPIGSGLARWHFSIEGGGRTQSAVQFVAPTDAVHNVTVRTDPAKHEFAASMDGLVHLNTSLAAPDENSISVPAHPTTGPFHVTSLPTPSPTLCESLNH